MRKQLWELVAEFENRKLKTRNIPTKYLQFPSNTTLVGDLFCINFLKQSFSFLQCNTF